MVKVLRILDFPLVLIVVLSVLSTSCDSWRTVQYSILFEDDAATGAGGVRLQRDVRSDAYHVIKEVASQYGLQSCVDSRCRVRTCNQLRENSCKEFQASTGAVQGFGAPVMRVLRRNDGPDIIQITYFVGPTEPFINFERDLKNRLEEQHGINVVRH